MLEIIKFIYRLSKHLITLFFVIFPLQLLSIIAIAAYLPIHRRKVLFDIDKVASADLANRLKLPFILRWFDNADIYVGRDFSTYFNTVFMQDSLWYHWYWLTLRNPLNYFGYVILGKVITLPILQVLHTAIGTEQVGDATNGIAGLFYTEVETAANEKLYEYYYIKPYNFFGQRKCFRFRLGHKLGLVTKPKDVQWVTVISPYHDYSGA